MPLDTRTRKTAGTPRRQYVILGTLASVAVLLAVVRLLNRGPSVVLSDTTGAGVDRRPSDTVEPGTYWSAAPIDVTWPIELHRDLFAGNEMPARPQETITIDANAIRAEATAKVKLNAVILGDPPRAVINGKPSLEGDVVEGFRILRIERHRIVVTKQGIVIEIKL